MRNCTVLLKITVLIIIKTVFRLNCSLWGEAGSFRVFLTTNLTSSRVISSSAVIRVVGNRKFGLDSFFSAVLPCQPGKFKRYYHKILIVVMRSRCCCCIQLYFNTLVSKFKRYYHTILIVVMRSCCCCCCIKLYFNTEEYLNITFTISVIRITVN